MFSEAIAMWVTSWAQSTEDGFVAGSIYGGVQFTFVDGRVTEIFVGGAF